MVAVGRQAGGILLNVLERPPVLLSNPELLRLPSGLLWAQAQVRGWQVPSHGCHGAVNTLALELGLCLFIVAGAPE